ncbi:MAG: 4-hydroxy-tetrahydrodipicolinate reductase [Kiritimatiellae bacterium]|jgi:4-hydroxy-tetrahydrodipicolinate reductase|nr:4-hydroxy-tetrahydrodipicolinate reductase [Kiritimatiellia bacterium]
MKIAILGAGGRMGYNLLDCASTISGCEIVAACERSDHPAIDQTVKSVAGISSDAVPESLCYSAEWPTDAEVIIDFTFHTCVPSNVANAVKYNQAFVLGTTGLTDEEKQAVADASQTIAIVWAPNMSLGVNLMLELVRRSASILGNDYDAEIIEMHHKLKKDAPSGTAIGLAEALAEGREVDLKDVVCYGREGITGERPSGEIAIHALRGGSVVGDHTVMFTADEERVEITHKAVSRKAFAKGALCAALWLSLKQPGIYTMRHVLGFEAV